MSLIPSVLRGCTSVPAGHESIPSVRGRRRAPAGDVPAAGRASRNLLLAGLAAMFLALSACGGGGGGKPPTGGGGITPAREVVIGFPGLLGGEPDEVLLSVEN